MPALAAVEASHVNVLLRELCAVLHDTFSLILRTLYNRVLRDGYPSAIVTALRVAIVDSSRPVTTTLKRIKEPQTPR